MRARSLLLGVTLACLLVGPAARSEMYRYVDSEGRLHFTQDIGQVPPEYRDQVETQVLEREISITGEGHGQSDDQRVQEMKKRASQLQRNARRRARTAGARTAPVPAALRPADPLLGAPEPRKYDKKCWWETRSDGQQRRKCVKSVTAEWRAWDIANGGGHGRPTTRRRVGE